MKILGIGESVVDNVYRIEGEVPVNFNPNGLHSEKHVGGPVLTAMIVLSRLGIDCTYMTSVGRDADAELIHSLMKHEKVRLLPKYQHKTKINTIVINKKTGQRVKLRGSIKHDSIKDLTRNFLHQFDLIIIDRHEQHAFYEILKKKKASTKIVIDPSTEISKFTLDMIKHADYPIIPIEAVTPTYTGSLEKIDHVLKRLYEWTNKPLIITAGDMGSFVYNGETAELLPPLSVTTIDTTGAGDIYRGAFAYGIIQGWNLKKTARFSNIVAALQCKRLGNAAAIPTKEEIMQHHDKLLGGKTLTSCTLNNIYLCLFASKI
ncbi:MAG TPA: PfkB family carbohydrate kinase [Candidatus Saccharimonadales bacterium]|nr:PfkB family carbohydrate kinase [Candidatus Saccharimonadales bacterium]